MENQLLADLRNTDECFSHPLWLKIVRSDSCIYHRIFIFQQENSLRDFASSWWVGTLFAISCHQGFDKMHKAIKTSSAHFHLVHKHLLAFWKPNQRHDWFSSKTISGADKTTCQCYSDHTCTHTHSHTHIHMCVQSNPFYWCLVLKLQLGSVSHSPLLVPPPGMDSLGNPSPA